jgi:hypothetical protein
MIKKEMYICEYCGEAFTIENLALDCERIHNREKLANKLLNEGKTLEDINNACDFHWSLKDIHKNITKDNCFKIPHWQCCEKPAYHITHFNGYGSPYLWGTGSWSGAYGSYIQMYNLPIPYPKEELFIDTRYKYL